MKPTVYIPTLRAGERLAQTLAALGEQETRPQVVVADNSDSGLATELAADRFPWVEVVAFGENLGFGKALNRAVRERPGDPVILLNDDATVEPGFVEALLAAGTEAEMAAAVLLREREPDRIDSAGIVADRTLLGFDYLSGEPVDALVGAPDPLGPTGGAALYSHAAFTAVDGFDERMFLYYEDLDLALRIVLEGGRCRLAPGARGLHAYSETLGANSARKYAMTGWSRGYLMRVYGLGGRPRLLGRAVAGELAICAGQALLQRTLAGASGRVRGWRAGSGVPRRAMPTGALSDQSLRRSMQMRRRRSAT